MEHKEVRAGRAEVERFGGWLREFGGSSGFGRRVGRTGRFVLGAALFGVVLLVLTACGGGGSGEAVGGGSDGGGGGGAVSGSGGSGGSGSDRGGGSSSGDAVGGGGGGTGGMSDGDGGGIGTSGLTAGTKKVSNAPISQGCQPPDMENCYGYEDMQAYLDLLIPLVEQFSDAAYADMPSPTEYAYVSEGETGPTGCTDGYTDEAYFYCPADETIYIGQRQLWTYYSELGDAAPAAGLAHEWGHHVQTVVGVPPAETPVGQIGRENQADCIAGAWIAYTEDLGLLEYPDDLRDIDGLLKEIASDESGRSHGDIGERTDSLLLGYEAGLQGCNDFYPSTPVFIVEEPTTTSVSPGQSTQEIEAEAEEAAGDYYRAAGVEDWGYTYDHLDGETQGLFTRDEWFQKNEWFADNGSVVYHIESVERLGTSSGVVVEVTLRLTFEDGSSSTRTTYFVYEDGEWKHGFGQEEYDLFMPGTSYEDFVAAQQ